MRVCSCLLIVGAALAATPGAAATDGRMGALSSGTVTIRVSVAPRAWRPGEGTLCVAAPTSGYSLRLADSGRPVAATIAPGLCVARAQGVILPPAVRKSGDTLLIVAE